MFISKGPDENIYFLLYNCHSIVLLIASVLMGAINVRYSTPRLLSRERDYKSYNYLVNQAASLFYFLMVPAGIGIMILGRCATVIYSSEKYLEAGIVTFDSSFQPAIIWILSWFLVSSYLYQTTVISNRLLLPWWWCQYTDKRILYFNNIFAPGITSTTTIIAETIVVLLDFILSKPASVSLKKFYNLNTL